MTLNITVATPRCIYQAADYRLLDWSTGQLTDFDSEKVCWSTTFAGRHQFALLASGERVKSMCSGQDGRAHIEHGMIQQIRIE